MTLFTMYTVHCTCITIVQCTMYSVAKVHESFDWKNVFIALKCQRFLINKCKLQIVSTILEDRVHNEYNVICTRVRGFFKFKLARDWGPQM